MTLDDLDRKARPIAEWDEERDAEEHQCVACKSSVNTPPDLDPSSLCNLCAQSYAVAAAPVVLALIARIRDLERVALGAAELADCHCLIESRDRFQTVAEQGVVLP